MAEKLTLDTLKKFEKEADAGKQAAAQALAACNKLKADLGAAMSELKKNESAFKEAEE